MADKLKVRELRKLPNRKWDDIKAYNELLVITSGFKHDSGYAIMYIIGRNRDANNVVVSSEIAAGCDDISWETKITESEWDLRTDMYYPSGVTRYWSDKFRFEVGMSLSSTRVRMVSKDKVYDE